MSDFANALAVAKDTDDPRAYIDRVKATVNEEIRRLDPAAVVEDTQYFNHSAIPDLVVRWPREKTERAVYLRDSYESMIAANDLEYVTVNDPIVFSTDTTATPKADSVAEQVRHGVSNAPQTLITDARAVDILRNDASEDEESPLNDLVRANFVRGARGLVDRLQAEQLVGLPQDDSGTGNVEKAIQESFSEAAATRITRTAQLMNLANGGDSTAVGSGVGGVLSQAELVHLLPWLLRQPRAVSNARFWRYFGTLTTFSAVEEVRDSLVGLDVTPLIVANSDRWVAKRTYVGVVIPPDDIFEVARPSQSFWNFDKGALSIEFGEQRLSVANKGTLLKERPGQSSAAWADVDQSLEDFRLARVELNGIRRSFRVSAEQSDDVRGDVEDVAKSLDDDYFVSEVSVRFLAPGPAEGTTDAAVKFGTGVVVADQGASIKDLARASLQILNFRQGMTRANVDLLLPDPSATTMDSGESN